MELTEVKSHRDTETQRPEWAPDQRETLTTQRKGRKARRDD